MKHTRLNAWQRTILLFTVLALVLTALACGGGEPQQIEVAKEVTRIVPQTVEVEVTRGVPQTVEVTRVVPRTVEVTRGITQIVEVTRVVLQTAEVTRVAQVVVTATPQPARPTPKPTDTPPPLIPSPTPMPAGQAATFGDGTYIVGSDIAPGRYRARNLSFCYWERLSGLGGSFDETIANGNPSGSSAVVEIRPTDKGFSSSGCGEWTTDLSAVTSSTTAPFSDGTYIVGVDIAPGTWRSPGGGLCYWERLGGFSGEFGDIIANGVPGGQAIVTIASTDVGFSTSGCGEWNLQ